eukprot:COSAG06_NODE_38555_length_422_cov_0.811146_2_plen_32_part_01
MELKLKLVKGDMLGERRKTVLFEPFMYFKMIF